MAFGTYGMARVSKLPRIQENFSGNAKQLGAAEVAEAAEAAEAAKKDRPGGVCLPISDSNLMIFSFLALALVELAHR